MTESLANQLRRETAKRDRCWAARERWRVLQETITWAEAQQNPPRNSVQSCLARQRILTAGIGNCRKASPRVAEAAAPYGNP